MAEGNASSFPDDSQSGEADLTDCLKWKELPESVWFAVVEVMPIKTRYGGSYILTLISRDGVTQRYWTTRMIGAEIEKRIGANAGGMKVYVKSLGKRSNAQKTSEYFDFDIMCK